MTKKIVLLRLPLKPLPNHHYSHQLIGAPWHKEKEFGIIAETSVLANLAKFTPCGGAEAVASLRCRELSVHSEPREQVRTTVLRGCGGAGPKVAPRLQL